MLTDVTVSFVILCSRQNHSYFYMWSTIHIYMLLFFDIFLWRWLNRIFSAQSEPPFLYEKPHPRYHITHPAYTVHFECKTDVMTLSSSREQMLIKTNQIASNVCDIKSYVFFLHVNSLGWLQYCLPSQSSTLKWVEHLSRSQLHGPGTKCLIFEWWWTWKNNIDED